MVRVAQKANFRTHVVVTGQTKLAMITVERGLKCPAVARNESAHADACLHNPSCRFVPEYHRVDIRSAANPAVGVRMQIGPADANGLDPDLHLSRSGIFNWHVSNPECSGSDELGSAH